MQQMLTTSQWPVVAFLLEVPIKKHLEEVPEWFKLLQNSKPPDFPSTEEEQKQPISTEDSSSSISGLLQIANSSPKDNERNEDVKTKKGGEFLTEDIFGGHLSDNNEFVLKRFSSEYVMISPVHSDSDYTDRVSPLAMKSRSVRSIGFVSSSGISPAGSKTSQLAAATTTAAPQENTDGVCPTSVQASAQQQSLPEGRGVCPTSVQAGGSGSMHTQASGRVVGLDPAPVEAPELLSENLELPAILTLENKSEAKVSNIVHLEYFW